LTEYPTGLQFLNQHGDISLLAEGITAMERKYLEFVLLQMSATLEIISDIIIKNISKRTYTRYSAFENTTQENVFLTFIIHIIFNTLTIIRYGV
jgi:hypothetical protein